MLFPVIGEKAQPTATRLVEAFGSVGGVMRAPAPSVRQVAADGEVTRFLAAVHDLNIRALREEVVAGPVLSTSRGVDRYLRATMAGAVVEEMRVLHLDAGMRLIGEEILAIGSPSGVGLDPRQLFRTAISLGARSILLAHNHPSGNPEPSEDDVRSTRQLARIGHMLGVTVCDHVIVTSGGITSMMQLGLLGDAQ